MVTFSTQIAVHSQRSSVQVHAEVAHSVQPLSAGQAVRQPTGAGPTQPRAAQVLLQQPGTVASQPAAQLAPA